MKAIEGNPDFYFKQCSDILIHNFNIELALAPRNSPEAVTRLRMYPYYYIDNQQDDLPARCIRKVEQEIETLPPLLRHYREKEVIDIAIQPSMGYSALLPAIRTIVIGSVVLELETPKLQKSLAQTMLREELRRSADVAIGFSKTTHWMDACEEQLRTGVDDAERFLAARQFISKSNPQLYHKPTLQQYKESGWPIAGEMLVRYLAAKDELEILHSLAGCINPLSWVIMTKNKEGYVDAELAKLFPDVHNLAKNFEKQLEASLNHKHGVARKLTGRG